MADQELILAIKERKEDGLKQLIDRYLPYVTAIVRNLGANTLTDEDVEELVVDIFLAVWNHAGSLHITESIRPYLAQTARNHTISWLRRQKQSTLPFEEDILTVNRAPSPDEIAVQKEKKQIINELVERLPEPDKTIIIRHYFFGEKLADIADILGISLAAVKTNLHRCRKKLGKHFEERGGEF